MDTLPAVVDSRRAGLLEGRAFALLALLLVAPGCQSDSTIITPSRPARKVGAERPAAEATKPAPPSKAPPAGPSASAPATPAAPSTAAPRSAQPAEAANSPGAAPSRVVAIGDLHGDLEATRAALRLAGAIDTADHWAGGNLTLVQTGDQLDRGDGERQIVDLFARLAKEAAESGGRVIALNGNHETMNVQGDFRYVTPGGITAFTGVTPRSPLAHLAPAAYVDRAAAFLPGGAYALELAERDVVAVVGESVFVHGGVLPEHVSYGIERINRETREWMRSGSRGAPAVIASERAPVWVRDYSVDPVSPATCETLAAVLASLRVKRMVVGHTVQDRGITTACQERVYRIDVGLARYYGKNPVQVLEISGDEVRVLSEAR